MAKIRYNLQHSHRVCVCVCVSVFWLILPCCQCDSAEVMRGDLVYLNKNDMQKRDRMWGDRKRVISIYVLWIFGRIYYQCYGGRNEVIFFCFMLTTIKFCYHTHSHTIHHFLYFKQQLFICSTYRISFWGIFADRYRSHAYGMNCIYCWYHITWCVRLPGRDKNFITTNERRSTWSKNWIQSKENSTILTMSNNEIFVINT